MPPPGVTSAPPSKMRRDAFFQPGLADGGLGLPLTKQIQETPTKDLIKVDLLLALDWKNYCHLLKLVPGAIMSDAFFPSDCTMCD